MDRIAAFRVFYNQTIYPELVRLDRQRVRLLRLIALSALLLVGLLLVQVFLQILLVTLALAIPVGLYLVYLLYRVRKFRLDFKPKVMRLVLDFMDDSPNVGTLAYDAQRHIDRQLFDDSMLFESKADRYVGEDYINGSVNYIPFELSELRVREYSRVRERLNYVFAGVFFHAQFPNRTKGAVVLLPRHFEQYLSRTLKALYRKQFIPADAYIQNEAFRDYFLTYTVSATRLPRLLSEALQDTIIAYQQRTGADLYLSFIGQHLYIAVTEHKDLLEPRLWQSNVSFELVREFYYEVRTLLDILEEVAKYG